MIGKKEYSVQVEETGLTYQNTADQKQIKRLDITGVRPLVNTKPISFLLMLLFFFMFCFLHYLPTVTYLSVLQRLFTLDTNWVYLAVIQTELILMLL